MDQRTIGAAVREINAIRIAVAECREALPLAMDSAFDSAAAVYKKACEAVGVPDLGRITDPSAYVHVWRAYRGRSRRLNMPLTAMDESASSDYFERFPEARRIGTNGWVR